MLRSTNLLIALTALALGSALLLNHPFGPFMPAIGFLFFALLVFYRPSLFLVIIPALAPLIGFAPWTGWITFEELDLLILASATGGYARCAFDANTNPPQRTSFLLIVLALLMSLSVLVSMARGFSDAGGFVFGWFQGYDGAMNSVRIGKSFFLAFLLLPLIILQTNTPESNVSRKLALGCAIGLSAASLAALWERLAFTDLLNFSSDYRTTALFWEMHVGGAALDGWLLLTIPFSIWALRNSRSTLQITISLGLAALAAYASLTTFSRGVYLALAVALPILAWQTRRRAGNSHRPPSWSFFRWSVAIILLVVMAGLVFPTSGYRGLLALFGLISVSLSVPPVLRKISLAQFLIGSLVGIVAGAILVVFANFLPKGPYFLYTFLLALTFSTLLMPAIARKNSKAFLCMASVSCLTASTANIAGYWGGVEALPSMISALSILFLILIWATFTKQPLWPTNLRWQGSFLITGMFSSAIIAVFVGGAYMGDRFSTSGQDFGGRLAHWRQTVAMLQTPWDIVFGKGLGRFPANYFFAIPNSIFPGTYRINEESGNSFLSLVGARHPMSSGDILRISQRLSFASQGPFEVTLKARAKTNVAIHLEVCEKHLLYPAACATGQASMQATNGEWLSTRIHLEGLSSSDNSWYSPRFKMFSLGIGNQSGVADIDNIELATGGNILLKNGDFTHEMQHWFFTSDRDHMPWHAKNLLVNILFDQGAIGLMLFLLLTVCALWRLNFGKAANHELSPYLTAAIIGFLVVGMFDSLTDVPRLAFLYYVLILYALSLNTLGKYQTKTRPNHLVPESQVSEQ